MQGAEITFKLHIHFICAQTGEKIVPPEWPFEVGLLSGLVARWHKAGQWQRRQDRAHMGSSDRQGGLAAELRLECQEHRLARQSHSGGVP